MWELDHKESWELKNCCFWTVVLEKSLESPLDCKEIQPVHPRGNHSWIFFGSTEAETPIFWLPDVKNWLIEKDPDAGKDWRREEKGTTEDEMVGWHHRLNGHEFGYTLVVGDGQGGLACCSPWGRRVGHDWKTELNWTEPLPFPIYIPILQQKSGWHSTSLPFDSERNTLWDRCSRHVFRFLIQLLWTAWKAT